MKVSVIIVAKNANEIIRYCLDSLLKQTVKPLEIIVVVDSLMDSTVEAVKDLPVKVVLNEGEGVGMARKTGVNVSMGDIISFIDADCVADKQWIAVMIKTFSKCNVTVLAGNPIAVKCLGDIPDEIFGLSNEPLSCLNFAPTMNFAFKREIIDIIGTFDSWFSEGGEDLDFCIRLRKAGYKIFYNHSMKIYHLAHGSNFRRAVRDGKSRAQNLVKHGRVMRNDVLVALFHVVMLVGSLILLTAGYFLFAFFFVLLSVFHRFYRAIININQGNPVIASIKNSFIIYISYIAFTFILPILVFKYYNKLGEKNSLSKCSFEIT